MDRFDPFVKYADVYGDIINWEKDPMNKPQNQNKYFFSDGKTYYEQICKMLRLMSVFKEAFNQIYSNEDEISEAWENFVNNLSASVVEGSEPDVTLTWTDDSVNFEFTMVPGAQGEQGVGITSISFNSDYTMTITLSDGNTYTSMSLKGETGPQGPQGETGSGLQILDVYATLADLQSAHPTGQPGDAYQVGSAGNYILYIWSSSQSAWVQAGTLGTVSPSTSAPLMDGTASAGSQNVYSRGDHVHPSDTSRASKEEMDALIKTSQALIDQSFTYRESPAIQDGLARFDKIKGNTLVWNQLIQNGNFESITGYGQGGGRSSLAVSNNIGTATLINTLSTTYQNYGTVKLVQGHKILVHYEFKVPRITSRVFACENNRTGAEYIFSDLRNVPANVWQTVNALHTVVIGGDETLTLCYFTTSMDGYELGDQYQLRNFMCIDLTAMFGAGNEPTSVAEFTKLFPLPYYSYNTGELLSFNGTGIKTVSKNQFDTQVATTSYQGLTLTKTQGTIRAVYSGGSQYAGFNFYGSPVFTDTFLKGKYRLSFDVKGLDTQWTVGLRQGASFLSGGQALAISNDGHYSFTIDAEANPNCYLSFARTGNKTTAYDVTFSNIQLELGTTETSYTPFEEKTISLPISTYFPTGMKSAGSVYDELTESKAITRIGAVDLGTLDWSSSSTAVSGKSRWNATVNGIKLAEAQSSTANILTNKYKAFTWNNSFNANVGDGIAVSSTAERLSIYDESLATSTAESVKSSLSGVYLYYELATETETSIDPDLIFKSYLDGTEQLFPVNGSVPLTSPILADISYLSIDDAMEYIIDKLANVPQNTQQILESLEDDVADLQTDVGALQPAVSTLQTSVGNINTNIGQLSSTVAGHTASISDMQSDITDLNTGLSNLEDTVTGNTSRIGTLETGLSTTNGNVQNLETSVSDLDDTVTAQGTTVTALDSIISDISNNPVVSALGSHELGFVAAYVEATLAANAGTRVTIPKPVIFPNNYTPLFIVGMSTGSSDVSICEIPPTFGSRDSVSCRVWNHGSQQTVQVTVYILCMRQRQSQ